MTSDREHRRIPIHEPEALIMSLILDERQKGKRK
jgi:hypothetical protein